MKTLTDFTLEEEYKSLRFLSGNFLVFLNAYHKVPQSEHSEKELLITT